MNHILQAQRYILHRPEWKSTHKHETTAQQCNAYYFNIHHTTYQINNYQIIVVCFPILHLGVLCCVLKTSAIFGVHLFMCTYIHFFKVVNIRFRIYPKTLNPTQSNDNYRISPSSIIIHLLSVHPPTLSFIHHQSNYTSWMNEWMNKYHP